MLIVIMLNDVLLSVMAPMKQPNSSKYIYWDLWSHWNCWN